MSVFHIANKEITYNTDECNQLIKALRWELLKLEINEQQCRYIVFSKRQYEQFLAWRYCNSELYCLVSHFNNIEIVVVPSEAPLAFLSHEDLYLNKLEKLPNKFEKEIYAWFEKNKDELKGKQLEPCYWVVSKTGYQHLVNLMWEHFQDVGNIRSCKINKIFNCKLVISPDQRLNLLVPNLEDSYLRLD